LPNTLRSPPPVTQIQPTPGYTDIDKIERRLNSSIERMVNANIKKMMRMMTEQFFQLASSSKEASTFPNQPEMNPKGLVSSFGPSTFENVRKINAIISFRSVQEIDNQVENFKEPCKFPYNFSQNSSPSSPPETGSFGNSGDTTNGIPSDYKRIRLQTHFVIKKILKKIILLILYLLRIPHLFLLLKKSISLQLLYLLSLKDEKERPSQC